MRKIYLSILLSLFALAGQAQVSFSNGNVVTEIHTATVVMFNQRFYDSTERNHKKNGFGLDDARIGIESRSPNMEFKFEFDLSVLGSAVQDPTAPPITEAYFTYKGLEYFNIKSGFQKVPYSRDNLEEHFDMPFMQRPELDKGTIFNRRDVGVTLYRTFWDEKINAYAGLYSGQGGSVLTNINDASGSAEYAGRIDIAYPCKYKYIQIDETHTPIPIVQLGLNARYIQKPLSTGFGNNIYLGLEHQKSVYGFDIAAAYQGLSFQFELDRSKVVPNNPSELLGLPTTYFLQGGASAQLNYHSKKLRSVFCIRYDELNPNDLSPNDTYKALSFAYNYLINGYRCVLKIQYTNPIKGTDTVLAPFDPQMRIGWQYWFK